MNISTLPFWEHFQMLQTIIYSQIIVLVQILLSYPKNQREPFLSRILMYITNLLFHLLIAALRHTEKSMKATQLLIRTYQSYMSVCCMLQILLVILQNEIQRIYLSIINIYMKILIQR